MVNSLLAVFYLPFLILYSSASYLPFMAHNLSGFKAFVVWPSFLWMLQSWPYMLEVTISSTVNRHDIKSLINLLAVEWLHRAILLLVTSIHPPLSQS